MAMLFAMSGFVSAKVGHSVEPPMVQIAFNEPNFSAVGTFFSC